MLLSRIRALAHDRPLTFVLSPGRTGTVFLTRLVDRTYDGVHCVHEPRPSRALLVGGNIRNHHGPGGRALRTLFEAGLYGRLRSLPRDTRYVEVNPLMTTTFDLIADLPVPFHVLHMTRDPRTWAPSLRTFKASGYRRHVIDFLPIASVMPVPLPDGWKSLPLLHRALWQWRYINERIEELFADRGPYDLVRYEDVFSSDPTIQRDAVARGLAAMGLDPAPGLSAFDSQDRVNPAPGGRRDHVDEEVVARICGDTLTRYGYEGPSTG